MSLAAKQAPIRPSAEEIEALAAALELSQNDLGHMFGVTGSSIRRWRNGAIGIPPENRARISEAMAALERLQQIFLPGGLARAIRRKVNAFDGDAAIDWILRGRIQDVADIYEFVLSYQASGFR